MARDYFRLIWTLALAALLLLILVVGGVLAGAKDDPSDELYVPPDYLLASGGPDRLGYTYTDSDGGGCLYAWRQPGAAAVDLAFSDADDSVAAIEIGFEFPYYGRDYRSLTVDSNGALLLESGPSDWVNRPIGVDGPSARLAPFWDDLVVSAVRADWTGTAPERVLVVTFETARPVGRFQALLHEDGRVVYQYESVRDDGSGATVGIQGPTAGLGYIFNGFPSSNRLHENLAICFQPPAGIYLSPGLQASHARAGESARFTLTAVNQSGADGLFYFGVESPWPATVTPRQAEIRAGESLGLVVAVQAPGGVDGRTVETLVRMTSAEGLETAARLRTTLASGKYGYTGASTNDTLAVFDLSTNMLLTTLSLLPEADYPYDATMRPDGSEVWLVGASGDGVVVLDTISNTITERVSTFGTGEYPVDVLFAKYANEAYVSNRDNPAGLDAVAVIDTVSYTVIDTIPIPSYYQGPGKMTLNPCSGEIYMAYWYTDRFFVIDPISRTVTADLQFGTSLWDLTIDPSAATVYVTDRGQDRVHVFDLSALTVTHSIPVGDDPWGIGITPDGQLLFVANEDSHNVSVIDTALGIVTATLSLPAADADPRDVDVSQDGNYAYVPSGSITGDDAIYVIDVHTLTVVDTINVAPASNPNVVAVAPQLANLDPNASFTATTPVELGTPVLFTDTSQGGPTQWYWDFGDGLGTSAVQHPVYDYANPGTYTVTLMAANRCGGDVVTGTVTVEPVTIEDHFIYLPIIARD